MPNLHVIYFNKTLPLASLNLLGVFEPVMKLFVNGGCDDG